MYQEITERKSAGVTVKWHRHVDNGSHLITVLDADGVPVAVLKELTPEQASEAFDHPFANRLVPDIFSSKTEDIPEHKRGYTYPDQDDVKVCRSCRQLMWRIPHTCQDGPPPDLAEGAA